MKPPQRPREEIKDRLRRLRERAGFNTSQLAHAVGITEGAIRQMESGQTKWPSFPIGILLARELGVTPEYLAFGEDGAPGRVADGPVGGDAVADLQRRVEALETDARKPRRR